MKKHFPLFLFSFLFSISLQAQFYGVGFNNINLEDSGGADGWSSDGDAWRTNLKIAPTVTGIDSNPKENIGYVYAESDGSTSIMEWLSTKPIAHGFG